MFLYVEGQLIQYFCFECTQSKSTMYIIKIHLPGLTVCMMLESQRWGWYLNTMRWQHSWQNVDRIEKCGKNRVEPWSLPLKGSTLKIHNNTCPRVSLSIQNGKRKRKVKEKDWKGLDGHSWNGSTVAFFGGGFPFLLLAAAVDSFFAFLLVQGHPVLIETRACFC